MRADPAATRARTARALARIDPAQSRGVTARAWHALGIVALADGDHLMAYAQLRQLFYPDGSPLHYHVSYLGVADLAAAAVRAGRQLEGREILDRALRHMDGSPSPRLEQLLARARGILADPASAEPHFDKALSDPSGERWPFERAQLQLDYAEWMRRDGGTRTAAHPRSTRPATAHRHPGNLPATPGQVLGATCRNRAASVRGQHSRCIRSARRPGRAHSSATPDHPPG